MPNDADPVTHAALAERIDHVQTTLSNAIGTAQWAIGLAVGIAMTAGAGAVINYGMTMRHESTINEMRRVQDERSNVIPRMAAIEATRFTAKDGENLKGEMLSGQKEILEAVRNVDNRVMRLEARVNR